VSFVLVNKTNRQHWSFKNKTAAHLPVNLSVEDAYQKLLFVVQLKFPEMFHLTNKGIKQVCVSKLPTTCADS